MISEQYKCMKNNTVTLNHFSEQLQKMLMIPVCFKNRPAADTTGCYGIVMPWLMKQVDIDKCLDSGGAFDYEAQTCIYERKRD